MDPLKAGNPEAAADPAENKGQSPVAANATPSPADAGAQVGDQTPKGPMPPEMLKSALHESREQNKTLRGEMDNLRGVLNNLQQQIGTQPQGYAQPAPPQQQTLASQNAAILEKMWDENPRQAMQTEMSMMLNWYETQAELDKQEEEAAKKFTDYDKYRNTIRRYVRMVKPEQRRNPGTVDTAYYLSKGQNTDAIRQSAIEETIRRIKAGEQIQGFEGASSTGVVQDTSVVRPTEDQMKAADAMGMSPEDYLKYVKK